MTDVFIELMRHSYFGTPCSISNGFWDSCCRVCVPQVTGSFHPTLWIFSWNFASGNEAVSIWFIRAKSHCVQ